MVVDEFTDRAGFEQLLPGTFGSQEWLGTENDHLLIDNSSRELVDVGLQLPAASAPAQDGIRLPAEPRAFRGGPRAREVRLASLPLLLVSPDTGTSHAGKHCIRATFIQGSNLPAENERSARWNL